MPRWHGFNPTQRDLVKCATQWFPCSDTGPHSRIEMTAPVQSLAGEPGSLFEEFLPREGRCHRDTQGSECEAIPSQAVCEGISAGPVTQR